MGCDFSAVVVLRRKFGIVLAINGIVVCSVGFSFPLNAFLRKANRKFCLFSGGAWVCPKGRIENYINIQNDSSNIGYLTYQDRIGRRVCDLPMWYNYVVWLILSPLVLSPLILSLLMVCLLYTSDAADE